jgi:putative tryptophan/tyrosine transport system substrate-binding protein
MRRRDFIALIGSMAVTRPLTLRAQQSAVPVIGFLNGQTAASFAHLVAAFRQGLTENGFVEGKNVTIEYNWADRHFDRLPALATDLVARSPTVIVATGGAHDAAMAATETIPIVCSFGGDPVRLGLVASLNKPGRNVTRVTVLSADLEAKKLELLSEVVPRGAAIGYLIDPNFDAAPQQRQAVETAGQTIGRPVRIVEARGDGDLEKAFAALAEMWQVLWSGLILCSTTPVTTCLR